MHKQKRASQVVDEQACLLLRTVVRIACAELESFYLGDLKAVEDELNIPKLAKKQSLRPAPKTMLVCAGVGGMLGRKGKRVQTR